MYTIKKENIYKEEEEECKKLREKTNPYHKNIDILDKFWE